MIQQCHYWGDTQKNATHITPKAFAHPYLSQSIHNSYVMEIAKMPHYRLMD
jgi:hypothetical protein